MNNSKKILNQSSHHSNFFNTSSSSIGGVGLKNNYPAKVERNLGELNKQVKVNLFKSDKNSLHFENNVVVLKNSKFLLNRFNKNEENESSFFKVGAVDKNNYIKNYKNQIQNYIIEKYKNILNIPKPEGIKTDDLKEKLLGSPAPKIDGKNLGLGEEKKTFLQTVNSFQTKKIIIQNLLNQLGSWSFAETVGSLGYKKVDKNELDNIKKGSLLPKNFVKFITLSSALREDSQVSVSLNKAGGARLRQYLNLISNTNIAVNLALPANKDLLLIKDNLGLGGFSPKKGSLTASNPNQIATLGVGDQIKTPNGGLLFNYNKIISYNFLNSVKYSNFQIPSVEDRINKKEFIEDLYKLLFYFFKSIYCLIGKPVIQFSPEKITINLFYFLNIPKRKVFRLFAIHNLANYKEEYKRLILKKRSEKEINKLKKENRNSSVFLPISSLNLNSTLTIERESQRLRKTLKNMEVLQKNIRLPLIKFRYQRAISRLKSKPENIRNTLFNLRKSNLANVFFNKFKIISKFLSNKFNKPIEFNLIRLHKPYLDSNILVNLLQLIVKNKKRKPRGAINKIYNKTKISAKKMSVINALYKKKALTKGEVNYIPTYLSGLSIYINGRLMREPILPRITTKKFESGASATGKVNFLDVSTITKKNRKGAYTIKIKTGQNLY